MPVDILITRRRMMYLVERSNFKVIYTYSSSFRECVLENSLYTSIVYVQS